MTFFPLDRDLLTSSTWARGTPEQIKVWLYLLLAADPRTGFLEDTPPAIAMRCALPLDVTQAALEWLAAPDPYSRTKAHEGRKIKISESAIEILNYIARRDKDYSTPRVKRFRERKRGETRNSVSSLRNAHGNDEHEHQHEDEHPRKDASGACAAANAPASTATTACDALDFDPTDELEASVAARVTDLAARTETAPCDMLSAVSATKDGKTLDRIRGAPRPWLAATLRTCARFASENL